MSQQIATPESAQDPKHTTTALQPQRPTLSARIRYRFDMALARGPMVVILWLGLLTLAVIIVAAVIFTLFKLTGVAGGSRLGLFEAMWQALLRVIDAGTFSGDVGWFTRLIGLLVTLAGIFIAGSLIGLIASAVDQRIEELRKGRSNVLENDHTLILGWSERVPAVVSELVIANESRKLAAVVVVADVDKTMMEDALRDAIDDFRTTRIVCRSGEPWVAKNLEIANLPGARSVVVVGDGDDDNTIKTLLAIRAANAGSETAAHVVIEVNDPSTAASVKSLLSDGVITVSSDEVVAELTAQSCRQRGLSVVFRELLDFDGDEMYIAPFDELTGHTYAEAQLAFDRAAIMGMLTASGEVVLNPSATTVLAAGDQLIGICEDDSVFIANTSNAVAGALLQCEPIVVPEVARRIVITGWSKLGPRVVSELDEFLHPGTIVELLVDPRLVNAEAVRTSVSTTNVVFEVTELAGGPEKVAAYAARHAIHEVIVLGYRDALTLNKADTRTLLTLLAFDQIRTRNGEASIRVVAEMLDQRNAVLAKATGADDFVVSSELTSLMLAQLSERAELADVFADLFDRNGCSIELRPAPALGAHGAACFADVVATASAMGLSAIGYRVAATGDVVVNPAKSAALALTRADEVLLVAPGAPT